MSTFWFWAVIGLVWSIVAITVFMTIYNRIDPFSEKGIRTVKIMNIGGVVVDAVLVCLAIFCNGWAGFWGYSLARFTGFIIFMVWTYRREIRRWFR